MITELDAFLPAGVALVVGSFLLVAIGFMTSRLEVSEGKELLLQLLGWFIGLVMLLTIVVALPLTDTIRGQILSLIGIVLTALIALSSTTFVANAMAGIMLHTTQPFRPGDFIEVDGVFGRVTRRSLVHTQLQTETRDFTTLPNMLLVNKPVRVLHREGTIIQAEVSLGYDVHHAVAERHLLKAATAAQLDQPYVLVVDLLDHAVVYRIAGFLADFNNPISARSALRQHILETLHQADIEITSPTVVAQRQQPGSTRTLPIPQAKRPTQDSTTPEQRIFDRADEAASREQLKQELLEAKTDIDAQKTKIKGLPKDQRESEEAELQRLEIRYATLQTQWEENEV